MPADFQSIPFDPTDARGALHQLPEKSAVFALYGEAANAEPYIGRTPNLRGRLERLLLPSAKHPRRLQLAGRVRRIEWRLTGSDFESLLAQFTLLEQVYGPFASRAAADRFAEETLKLFLLRRCTEDLDPNPSHPGCVYSEMKMCLAPCYQGCSDERYGEESTAVESFLATRGESRLVQLRTQRDEASAGLEFESAAAIHAQVQRAEAVRALAPELVRPLSLLRAVILQASGQPDEVAVFLFEGGILWGPSAFSTLGMRIQNEQSGSSSLFAQPMALEAVVEEQGIGNREQGIEEQGLGTSHPSEQRPLAGGPDRDEGLEKQGIGNREQGIEKQVPGSAPAARPARGMLEARLEAVLAGLAQAAEAPNAVERQGHLALLKRWYYRPEVKRPGEVFFPDAEGLWPLRSILRGVGRVAAKSLSVVVAGK